MTNTLSLFYDRDVGAVQGLAFDEAMTEAVGTGSLDAALRLYSYRDHVLLIGRFQRVEAELDLLAAKGLGMDVNRRPTGGGAIMMGSGQLGVALAVADTKSLPAKVHLIAFAEALAGALRAFGVEASLRGKNDLCVGDRKIAGLGSYRSTSGAVLLHASILMGIDIDLMCSVLKIPAAKYADSFARSMQERITTLQEEVDGGCDRGELCEALVGAFAKGLESVPCRGDNESLKVASAQIATERYSTQEWLFSGGRNTAEGADVSYRTSLGTIVLHLVVQGGIISKASVSADFLENHAGLNQLESALTYVPLVSGSLRDRITAVVPFRGLVDATGLAASITQTFEDRESSPIRIGSCYLEEEFAR